MSPIFIHYWYSIARQYTHPTYIFARKQHHDHHTRSWDDLHFVTNDVALSLCLCLALHGCWQGAEARDKPFSSHHVIRLCNYVTSYLVFIRQLAFTSSYNSVIKNFIKIILPKRYLTCSCGAEKECSDLVVLTSVRWEGTVHVMANVDVLGSILAANIFIIFFVGENTLFLRKPFFETWNWILSMITWIF